MKKPKKVIQLNEVKFIQTRKTNEDNTLVYRGRFDEVLINFWGCSSAGRAPALQAGGQEFDSPHLHQREQKTNKTTWAHSSGG